VAIEEIPFRARLMDGFLASAAILSLG
jgi:hypothetical protein